MLITVQLNTVAFVPRRNYQSNRLSRGRLQLAARTQVSSSLLLLLLPPTSTCRPAYACRSPTSAIRRTI